MVSKDTVADLIHQKFESPLPKGQDDDDVFVKGEFEVIKELLEKCPATVEGKKKIDRAKAWGEMSEAPEVRFSTLSSGSS